MKTENQILFSRSDWNNRLDQRDKITYNVLLDKPSESQRQQSLESHTRRFLPSLMFPLTSTTRPGKQKICSMLARQPLLQWPYSFVLNLRLTCTHTLQKTHPRDMCCRSLFSFSISSCLAAFDVDEINGTPSRYHYRWWMDFTATLQPPSYKRGHPEGGSKTCTVKDPKRKQTILKDTKFKSMKIKENLTEKRKVKKKERKVLAYEINIVSFTPPHF